ncbi:glycosyltransferase family 2 protein [Limnohabitans sp.]|uniref:glycosyltransferase family 2 protein n=1 Tax=Limnohabitans sp. TaxID=1907725 RepID=UPI00286ECF2C|nr:glycosyltransferase family 2 protein [Limnohabitans sp.]
MTHASPTLSAIVITRNEAHNLHDCLQSMHGLVDEIIVVDSQSTDHTVAIAQQHGAKVSQPADWPGFGLQKNRALDLATCDWVLSIDADERITPALSAEIKRVLQASDVDVAYKLPRLSSYCGKLIHHAGWQPDHVLRLFKRGKARFSDDLVHERVVTAQNVVALQNHLLHFSYLDFSQVLSKVNVYSSASAQQAYAHGKRSSVVGALGHGAWAFFRTYVLRAGFLDGAHGLALSISNAETSYYKYLKLWHIQQAQAATVK